MPAPVKPAQVSQAQVTYRKDYTGMSLRGVLATKQSHRDSSPDVRRGLCNLFFNL